MEGVNPKQDCSSFEVFYLLSRPDLFLALQKGVVAGVGKSSFARFEKMKELLSVSPRWFNG